ncbi:MAG TPA: lytic murein transglycosylase [Alphaproteobacteria bacterium]|nr:lytic murein transglycosylase [Alphaproteobacteria bacterium]
MLTQLIQALSSLRGRAALRQGLILTGLLLSAAGCSGASAQQQGGQQGGAVPQSATTSSTATTAPVGTEVAATPQPEFSAWLAALRADALKQGISQSTVTAALGNVAPLARVIELDRRQPEFTLTLRQYLERAVNQARVNQARAKLAENRALLEEVGRKYGVQPRFIVALWGIETNFGSNTGGFSVVQALATLAYDGRRSDYFRGELMNALKIIDAGHVSAANMKGSWAGAMGQNQFMPSSFLSYAQDYNNDGRRDIWTTPADVFASTANYLKQSGWRGDETWGREVRLPPGFGPQAKALMPAEPPAGCRANRFLSAKKPLAEWQKLGIRRTDGGDLPNRNIQASLALPEGEQGPALLIYDNFRTTLKWNCSVSFATAVGTLADRIEAP